VTRRFSTPGVYAIKLRVVDNGGASAVSTVNLIIASCLRTARCKPTLTATTTPKRDGKAPFAFVTRGKLGMPSGVRRAEGCAGRVVIQAKSGAKTIASRSVRVDRFCRFTGRITFPDRSKLGSAQSLRFVVRFRGNSLLASRTARAQTVRIA
jgi:hypothetical protein